ncbi:MAG: response regulator [Phycisphaerae bacterium]|nr:response regulator [Phycisphaerae bacterium]
MSDRTDEQGRTAPARLIVVDDEVHIVHVLALKLRNAGYDVRTAADGEEGCEMATQDPPDLIITDLQMPFLSGLEMCARLKKNQPTATIPVIMLTARGHALSQSDLNSTNIRLVLSKPFSPRQVLEEVERILGRASPGTTVKEAA